MAYGFTKLQRAQDWVGFSSTLPLLAGLTAVVIESADKHRLPGLILAFPPENVQEPIGSVHFPRGQASWLTLILKWHNVGQCYWLSRQAMVPKRPPGRPRIHRPQTEDPKTPATP